MQGTQTPEAQQGGYIRWIRYNIELINSPRLKQYPALYRLMIANHDTMRIFLTALLEVLIVEVLNTNVVRLPEKHGCIPVMLTAARLKEKLAYKGMYFSQGSLDQAGDVNDKLVLLHSLYLIKRAIKPRDRFDQPSDDYEKIPKYLFVEWYSERQLAIIEERVQRWEIVTGRRKKLNKDDIIWLFGQREADRIFVPSTRNISGASIFAKDTFMEAYRSAQTRHPDSPLITKKMVTDQLWEPMKKQYEKRDTESLSEYNSRIWYEITDTLQRAKIPVFMDYGLQNRPLKAQEKKQYGITDRTFWAYMPVDEETLKEMRSKRTDWEWDEEPEPWDRDEEHESPF